MPVILGIEYTSTRQIDTETVKHTCEMDITAFFALLSEFNRRYAPTQFEITIRGTDTEIDIALMYQDGIYLQHVIFDDMDTADMSTFSLYPTLIALFKKIDLPFVTWLEEKILESTPVLTTSQST